MENLYSDRNEQVYTTDELKTRIAAILKGTSTDTYICTDFTLSSSSSSAKGATFTEVKYYVN